MSTTILIADDHKLFREALINLLSDSPELEIVADVENGKDAYEKVMILKPDLILMNIDMPVLNGIEATALIKKQLPDTKIIGLSRHTNKYYIKLMLEAGANGYLCKSCSYQQLIEAIEKVTAGKKYLSDEITGVLIDDFIKGDGHDHIIDGLTKRELEVLKLYAEGSSTREISENIFVSIKTVGTHKQNILRKLNLKTTTDLIRYALKNGIVFLDYP